MLFVPRQVALASLPPAAAAAPAAMAKEEPRKGKKSKSKSKVVAEGSAAPDARRATVVASVAVFLESSGFPRTLAALQSEANLEGDAWRSSPVSLEDLVTKFFESSNSAPGASATVSNEQVKTADPVAVAGEEDADKKRKKKKVAAEAREPESKATEPSAPEKPIENADGETKEKKRKKKKDSSSAGNDCGVEANETVKSNGQKVDGNKKIGKKQENDEDVEARLEKVELAVKSKFEAAEKLKQDAKKSREEESKSLNDSADKNGLSDGAPPDNGKKKKKGKSTSETSLKVDAGTAATEVEGKSEVATENTEAADKGKDGNEKKSKKKSKKSGSEDKRVAEADPVPKSDDVDNSGMVIDKCEDGKPSTDNAVVGKKRKLEEVEGSKPTAKDDAANQNLNNGFAEDLNEHSAVSKPSKRQKHSTEPKTVVAFQRVKLDDVKFADERLQDNSYWAKGGADSGYGAKAQEILGQVRGRGFRHEKTKKKRGTYRGGMIDLQTHSIKFDNSDDE